MRYLILLALLLLVGRYLYKRLTRKTPQQPRTEVLKQDPVCGAYVPEDREFCVRDHGELVYFCSKECMRKYKELKQ
jgi:YHS domain-containing protein